MAQLNYKETVASLAENKPTQYSPVDGIIERAVIHFPSGCNGLVEVELYHKAKKIFPNTRGGIALDDATQTFSLHEPVTSNDPIQVIFTNHDGTNSHTLSAVIYISEKKYKVI